MQYMTSAQAAEKWGITASRVTMMAKNGQIPGVERIGHQWMIPENADKPADGRTKAARESVQPDEPFRFPLYLNFHEDAYSPPLSAEEKLLRRAEQAFYACRFEDAHELLVPLCDREANRYMRLAALYLRCYLAVYSPVEENLDDLLYEWNTEVSGEFPYKKEMLLLRSAFLLDYGYYKPIFDDFRVEPDYFYHPSAYRAFSLIALIPIENGRLSLLSKIRYDTQELLCQMMERDGYFFEAQQMHFLLLIVYQLKNDKENMRFHVRRGLQTALERDFYFYPAYYFGYYPDEFQEVLQEFPADFGKKLHALSAIIHESLKKFTAESKNPSFLGLLSDREFEYVFLASQDFSNSDVAQKLKVSEKIVSKMYAEIYDKLRVKNKSELIDLINRTHGGQKE